jgi:hypothetical protein
VAPATQGGAQVPLDHRHHRLDLRPRPVDRGFARKLVGWQNGDFDRNGVVDAGDYLTIDTAFAQAGNAPSPELLARRQAQFGDGYVTSLLASVPEPSSALFTAVFIITALPRHRSRGQFKGDAPPVPFEWLL